MRMNKVLPKSKSNIFIILEHLREKQLELKTSLLDLRIDVMK